MTRAWRCEFWTEYEDHSVTWCLSMICDGHVCSKRFTIIHRGASALPIHFFCLLDQRACLWLIWERVFLSILFYKFGFFSAIDVGKPHFALTSLTWISSIHVLALDRQTASLERTPCFLQRTWGGEWRICHSWEDTVCRVWSLGTLL